PSNGAGPGPYRTTRAGWESQRAQGAAIRVSTNAKRIPVCSATARQSAGVRPGETGTATQPARIAPSQAATQKKELSATIPTHSPRSAPAPRRNVATDDTAADSSPYECAASSVINAGRLASLPASSRSAKFTTPRPGEGGSARWLRGCPSGQCPPP